MKELSPRHNTQTLIGRRVRDIYAETGCGTIIGQHRGRYEVRWDMPTRYPSWIDLRDTAFWELLDPQ